MAFLEFDVAALRATAIGFGALLLRQFIVGYFESTAVIKSGGRPAEDTPFVQSVSKTVQNHGLGNMTEEEEKNLHRWRRVTSNDVENIPMSCCAILVALLCIGGDADSGTRHIVGVSVFVAARFLHSLAYGLALQPWRSISYLFGSASIVFILGNGIYTVYQ